MNERRHTREGGLIMRSCNATRRWRWVSLSVITRQFVERKSESKILSFQINRAVKAAHARLARNLLAMCVTVLVVRCWGALFRLRLASYFVFEAKRNCGHYHAHGA